MNKEICIHFCNLQCIEINAKMQYNKIINREKRGKNVPMHKSGKGMVFIVLRLDDN